ncbi:orotidine-5'-phosphate decarboxylase [Corynebacterium uterequi]|uniref:Orotidine 5'-phosphate decarboxylase n=1 Tax=Corynebacterium uterequi TaxID=1072256 RepID=A0A0G3HD32_9CORY|nr:orotidine-5'-phosphate decarboxylase [Corynebacterium uterequi]AKK11189.1 orotidine-5'-phosphate decarboxylase [Corynebacterium uterequi]
MTTTFGERLLDAAQTHGRLCVGIDPHDALLDAWGLPRDVNGLRTFTRTCVDAFAGHVALVKPQVAFFERYGSAGLAILEEALAALRDAGTLTLADAKRGDIGSTMAGYAEAWLGDSPLRADAVTVSPYLGVGALAPVFDMAQRKGGGVFVLAATSNPEAPALQQSVDDRGTTVAQRVVDECARLNVGASAGSIGVVVGATVTNPPNLDDLNGPVLMPGVGAQGASAEDVERIAGNVGHLAFPNVSRAILAAGPDPRDLQKCLFLEAAKFPGRAS